MKDPVLGALPIQPIRPPDGSPLGNTITGLITDWDARSVAGEHIGKHIHALVQRTPGGIASVSNTIIKGIKDANTWKVLTSDTFIFQDLVKASR
jgi:hypothetical protein